ncbi:BREX-1 system adenine-specific DNA-methyltransferase PglX [Stutzerimonas kunmingensis]|uniref:BREX-1 system adenine-specific DNA-methyltransferase PglX n=1 Tax=Stutzerimonas kunmingensis TaxID=1211807 RepID=UPI0028AE46B1|nr:BREX-1 system adenine-specific DNA-methyltransferase PglX [Stutzerimonas kunmingensis]
MNTANIKKYAPKARTAFIAAMTRQAARYGITPKGVEPLEIKGDLALIGDLPFPASIANPRAALARKVEQQGFTQAMEQAAYSWFNRLCALRYMEIHEYLDHGRRVLSAADGTAGVPQILDECLDLDLPGLDKQRIAELKLDGTKDEELYRELLLVQCHALHKAMPFLFEEVDDATELLLPDNLTRTDSLIRELVAAIPENDWQEVEVIGWLYQFYISEKKGQVMGKVVKSEDIPAATQLFTPNWIVQYLVQNSVGRQWLQTYPDSPLKEKMAYFIEPGEQPAEVQAQLADSTPESIDPLTIKVLDPACGSGHILVEAYKLLREIYTERGFRSRDIPQLILENNLFGLDIDDRAGQLAGFALMMLAREDDRRIFGRIAENDLRLNVLALQESRHLDVAALWRALNLTSDWQRGQSQGLFDTEQGDLSAATADNQFQLLKTTLARFTQAKTFGSLIDVPAEDAAPLADLLQQLRELAKDGDSMQKAAAQQLLPCFQQAWILAQRYDAVIANPPYMGGKGMNSELKDFAKRAYPDSKSDLFAVFIERAFALLLPLGHNAQVNMQSWMFLSSFESLRRNLITSKNIISLLHIGYNSFPELNSKIVKCCAFSMQAGATKDYKGTYIDLNSAPQSANKNNIFLTSQSTRRYHAALADFRNIPFAAFSYWVSSNEIHAFRKCKRLKDIAEIKHGLTTGNNDRFMRHWHELSFSKIAAENDPNVSNFEDKKWFLCQKGGGYRRWHGNNDLVVNYANNGKEMKDLYAIGKNPGLRFDNPEYNLREGLTWTLLTSASLSFRHVPSGHVFTHKGCGIFTDTPIKLLSYLSSSTCSHFLDIYSVGLGAEVGHLKELPIPSVMTDEFSKEILNIYRKDWESQETSYNFSTNPLVQEKKKTATSNLDVSFNSFLRLGELNLNRAIQLEEQNDNFYLQQMGLTKLYSTNKAKESLTLSYNLIHRFGKSTKEPNEFFRYRSEIVGDLASYAIGCIMGRYSLDREGLVYANSNNNGFSELILQGVFNTFPVDADGILPLSDQEWFHDDATNRFLEFIRVVWGDETLQENLAFVADSLCLHAIKPKRGESAVDTIRRYLSTQFYKDHLRTYKKRPIYWLFSSGKHKAFECLVYLHRYNEGTLARMRTEYVIPLTAKLNSYAGKLEKDKETSHSAAETKRIEKELDTLHKQQAELATFDEKLRHFADQRVSLDLDDGVKVNYGKFGDLLAEVKAVTGDKGD